MPTRPSMTAVAALLAFPAVASAQPAAVIVTQPQALVAPEAVVVLSPEQTTYVQQYVVAHPGPRATFVTSPVVGAELPEEVTVQTFAPDTASSLQGQRYGYVLTQTNETLVVDPATRRVIQILP